MKINFDGASKGNPGPSSVGCVSWDVDGNILALKRKNVGIGTNNDVEARATLMAVSLAEKLKVE